MRQHLNQGYKQLPLIFTAVFYNGTRSPYPYSTDIVECFEASQDLVQEYFMRPFKLIDLTVLSDEMLKRDIMLAPLQIIMKHIDDKDLLPVFQDLAKRGWQKKEVPV